jgi:alanine-alpha-ketoisovalerate/valine-pyruvate aminotransferase
MVSEKLIKELQIILREDYGKDLDIKDVADIANGSVNYFNLLAKIYHYEKQQV